MLYLKLNQSNICIYDFEIAHNGAKAQELLVALGQGGHFCIWDQQRKDWWHSSLKPGPNKQWSLWMLKDYVTT